MEVLGDLVDSLVDLIQTISLVSSLEVVLADVLRRALAVSAAIPSAM